MEKNIFKFFMMIIFVMLFLSCSSPKIIKLGSSYGSISENSKQDKDAAKIPENAVSSNTQSGSTVSFQTTFEYKGLTFQTGIDYVNSRHTISFDDTARNYQGRRLFNMHQFRVPFYYNINILRDFDRVPTIILHIGFSGGLTLTPGVTDEYYLDLPGYSFNHFDIGPQVGLTIQPLQLDYHHYFGLYVDFYKGTRVYKDVYHEDKGAGNFSFYKFGALLYFR